MIYKMIIVGDTFINLNCDKCGDSIINGEEVFTPLDGNKIEFFCYRCRIKKSNDVREMVG